MSRTSVTTVPVSMTTVTMTNMVSQNVAHVKPMPIPASSASGVSLLSSSANQKTPPVNNLKPAVLYQSVNVNVNGVVKSVLIPVSSEDIPSTAIPSTGVMTGQISSGVIGTMSEGKLVVKNSTIPPTAKAPTSILKPLSAPVSKPPENIILQMSSQNVGKPRVVQVTMPAPPPTPTSSDARLSCIASESKSASGFSVGSKLFMGSDGKVYMQVDPSVNKGKPPPLRFNMPSSLQAKPGTSQTSVNYKEPPNPLRHAQNVRVSTPSIPSGVPQLKIDSVYSLSDESSKSEQKVIEIAPIQEDKPEPSPSQEKNSESEAGKDSLMEEADDIVLNMTRRMVRTDPAPTSLAKQVMVTASTSSGHTVVTICPSSSPAKFSSPPLGNLKTVFLTSQSSASTVPARMVTSMIRSGSSPTNLVFAVNPSGTSKMVTSTPTSNSVYSISSTGYPMIIKKPASTSSSVASPVFKSMVTGQSFQKSLPAALQLPTPPPMSSTSIASTQYSTDLKIPVEGPKPLSRPLLKNLLEGKVVKGIKRPMELSNLPQKHPSSGKKLKLSSAQPEPTIMNYCHVVLEKFPKLKRKKRYRVAKLHRLWKCCPKCPLVLREKKLARSREQTQKEIPKPVAILPKMPALVPSKTVTPSQDVKQVTVPPVVTKTLLSGSMIRQVQGQPDPKGKYLLIKTKAGSFLVPMQQTANSSSTAQKLDSVQENAVIHSAQKIEMIKAAPTTTEVKVKQEPVTTGYEAEKDASSSSTMTSTPNISEIKPTPEKGKFSPESIKDENKEIKKEENRSDRTKEEDSKQEKSPESASERIKRLKEQLKEQQEELDRVNRRREETKKLLQDLEDDY